MHMADALLSTPVAGVMIAASASAAAVSVYKMKQENEPKKIAVMGVMGALVFGAQMINFTIPGTGSSGHLCGGMLVSAVLGPFDGFITMIGVLLLQCLLFADGGLLALGANIWNMAFYGCFIGALLIWHPIMNKMKASGKDMSVRIMVTSIIGSVLTLQLGAFSVVMETMLSGITELPFTWFVSVMQPIHLAIGLGEGLITGAVLIFIYKARPAMLWGVDPAVTGKPSKLAWKEMLAVLLVVAALLTFAISNFASSNPDGLEWSIEKLTGSTELDEKEDAAHTASAEIQEGTALLPDYSLKPAEGEEEAAAAPTVTGILVAVSIVAAAGVTAVVVRNVRRRKKQADESDRKQTA